MDFPEFHQWIYKEIGLNLAAYKQNQLNRRIESLMSRIGIKSLDEYANLIKNDLGQRQRFLDFITINVTEFYRNPELFNELEKFLYKEYFSKNKPIKAWSAACSTGCEPYSLAMMFKRNNSLNSRILATDIDKTILEKAKVGEYTSNEVKNIKKEEINKYFKIINEKYIIDQAIKSMVNFRSHDLILDRYEGGFDLILCRNVVIYFNTDVKNEIYKNFSDSLKVGGVLFVGATESIYNFKDFGFEKASTFMYRKV